MIVQIQGDVKFPITLDPTVWIFDDRKRSYDEIFNPTSVPSPEDKDEELKKQSKRFDREVYQQKINPPVNRSLHRREKERILEESFLMPIQPFIHTSEPKSHVESVTLITDSGEHKLDADRFAEGLFLFSKDGKPLKEDGPVHLYFADKSKEQTPIKGIKRIIFQ
ncbi:hypothetical protein LF817_06860 [Halobacillus sp. A1]|uniref:hypothetical protein n=1 Tax=Halobacillus sp. A1 TaxID=2880262 RepID=UPI0020A66E4B|nr:hypothetical protein [Halobacillus sp. A1]MCP3031062.1 hypothetical protein [Halobacillus sp. A1]